MNADGLDQLVEAVRAKASYAGISIDLIRWLGAQELNKRRNVKEAARHTRSRLHQAGGAYLEEKLDLARWQAELEETPREMQDPALQAFCQRLMAAHASSRERLPILDQFFQQTLREIAPLSSILDIGCGLTPLSIPWMPVSKDLVYYGLDIYSGLAEFLSGFLRHVGIAGEVRVYNLLNGLAPDMPPVQLAMLLKTVTCLELLDRTVTDRLLDSLQAEYLLVSYPVHSLGGKSKGMLATYERHFADLASRRGWQAKQYLFKTEMAFLVQL